MDHVGRPWGWFTSRLLTRLEFWPPRVAKHSKHPALTTIGHRGLGFCILSSCSLEYLIELICSDLFLLSALNMHGQVYVKPPAPKPADSSEIKV